MYIHPSSPPSLPSSPCSSFQACTQVSLIEHLLNRLPQAPQVIFKIITIMFSLCQQEFVTAMLLLFQLFLLKTQECSSDCCGSSGWTAWRARIIFYHGKRSSSLSMCNRHLHPHRSHQCNYDYFAKSSFPGSATEASFCRHESSRRQMAAPLDQAFKCS